jgi:NADH:ubiquinone oxidoreductase subunit 4 (subunit M)
MKLFAVGLLTRLVGLGLIWVGDVHATAAAKGSVVVGVLLSVGGIGVLRYMLFRGLFRQEGSAARGSVVAGE